MLRAAIDAALAGGGSLVLIGGEAGIGKTTLAEWALAEARERGALVLVGRCYDLSETPPYGPWQEVLARVPQPRDLSPPDLTGGGGAAGQAAFFAGVRDYCAALAARRPLVLLLDDFHWADPASLDLLRFLGRHLADQPILVLATYRADELTRGHPLYARLPILEREARASRLDLRHLDAAGVRALVAARTALPADDADRLVAWLLARAEGNAFSMTQLLRALEDQGVLIQTVGGWVLGDLGAIGLPDSLRQVLDARLARLGDEARRLLTLAAVIGQEVPVALWATVAAAGEDDLLEAIDVAAEARLVAVAPDGRAVRFAHALIREALYEGLVPTRRRRVHRDVAEALLGTAAPDPDTLAYQLQRAGDPRAAGWLVSAGERAQAVWAYQTAAARYEAALALLERDAAQAVRRAQVLARLARMTLYTDPARGIPALDEAERLIREAGDTAVVPHLACARGVLRCQVGDLRRGLAELEAGAAGIGALSVVEQAGLATDWGFFNSVASPDRAPAVLVLWLAFAGHLARARDLGEPLVARLAAARSPGGSGDGALADAATGLGLAANLTGQPAAARRAYALARAAAGDDQLRLTQAAADELREGQLVYAPDQLAERRRMQDLVDAAWARARGVAADAATDLVRVSLWWVEGRWVEARRGLETAAAAGPPSFRSSAAAALGALARAQGDRALAGAIVRIWLPDGPATAPGELLLGAALPLERLAAGLALDGGDLDEARAWLAAHDRWLAWSGAERHRAEGLLAWAAYHRAAGDPGRARHHAEAALANATDPRQPLALLAAHRTLGELDTAEGRNAEAAAHLDAALGLAEACAVPYERALTLMARAGLHRARGERAPAAAAIAAARTMLEPLEARPALARLGDLEAQVTTPPAAPPPALAAGLSAREAEVLRLVTQGLTNAQIAERLYLSPRTIEQHLRAAYNKLGVDNRAAATRAAVERGLA